METNNKEKNLATEENFNVISEDLIKNMENFTGEDEI